MPVERLERASMSRVRSGRKIGQWEFRYGDSPPLHRPVLLFYQPPSQQGPLAASSVVLSQEARYGLS